MRRALPAFFLAASLLGQDKPAPVRLTALRESPASTVTQEVGISKVEVAFARPTVKGRKIWGDLVPFGEVWRAGANSATVLTLSHPAQVAGRAVPAGTYGFFVIPGPKAWTLILNKKAKQWGAYDYKAEEDLLRWETVPQSAPFQEVLDYRLVPTHPNQITVELGWERLRVTFPIVFDTRGIYWTHLEERLGKAPDTDWVPWYQAAKYCQEMGLEPAKAKAWITRSLAAGESFWNHETAARIFREASDQAKSLTHLKRAIELSRGKAPKEYTDNLETELKAWEKPTPKP